MLKSVLRYRLNLESHTSRVSGIVTKVLFLSRIDEAVACRIDHTILERIGLPNQDKILVIREAHIESNAFHYFHRLFLIQRLSGLCTSRREQAGLSTGGWPS